MLVRICLPLFLAILFLLDSYLLFSIIAVIDGKEVVFRDYVDISVAVATPKGLVVPVIRDCDRLSFADVEKVFFSFGSVLFLLPFLNFVGLDHCRIGCSRSCRANHYGRDGRRYFHHL
jgi:hypothetical protein